MATFKYDLSEIEIRYYNPIRPSEVVYIVGATGTYEVSTFGTTIGYYLKDIVGGEIKTPLREATPVIASGRTLDGQLIHTHQLFSLELGEPVNFRYPLVDMQTKGEALLSKYSQIPDIKSRVGEKFNVVLETYVGTGYTWKIVSIPNSINLLNINYEHDSSANLGSPIREIFTFATVTPDQGYLEFVLERPWEGKPIDTKIYALVITQ